MSHPALDSASLGAALAEALESYRGFAALPAPEDAEGFAAHHAACKAALGHLEVLLRLVQRFAPADPTSAGTVESDLAAARAAAGLDATGRKEGAA